MQAGRKDRLKISILDLETPSTEDTFVVLQSDEENAQGSPFYKEYFFVKWHQFRYLKNKQKFKNKNKKTEQSKEQVLSDG